MREISEAVRAFSYGRFSTSFRSRADASRIVGPCWFERVERATANCRAAAPRACNTADRHLNVRVSNTVEDQILCSEPQVLRELTC